MARRWIKTGLQAAQRQAASGERWVHGSSHFATLVSLATCSSFLSREYVHIPRGKCYLFIIYTELIPVVVLYIMARHMFFSFFFFIRLVIDLCAP